MQKALWMLPRVTGAAVNEAAGSVTGATVQCDSLVGVLVWGVTWAMVQCHSSVGVAARGVTDATVQGNDSVDVAAGVQRAE